MSATWCVLAPLALAAGLCACRDERPAPRPPESRSTRPAAPRAEDAVSPPETRVVDDAATSAGADVAAASAVGGDAAEVAGASGDAVEPAVVDLPTCQAACQNALRVTLAELPADAAATMRAEIARALEDTCPSQCVKRGSLASVRCVAEAQTALELAACPR